MVCLWIHINSKQKLKITRDALFIGDEEKMLLCDGCDRGFHMYCLKPVLKKVPQGNWFCHDCKPMEIRTPQKKGRKKVEEEDDTEDSDDSEEEEDDDSDEGEQDSDDEEDEDADSDDEEGSEEESEEENADECTVCGSEGELILCDDCPRAYHVECVYPIIRKVPRGAWRCQICTKADLELSKSKRAATIEKNREKASQEETRPKKTQQRKPATNNKRSSSPAVSKTQAKKRAQSSPVNQRPAKKAKLENGKASSKRASTGWGRPAIKKCTALLMEIFDNDDSDIFVAPVDCKVVKDYGKFIDHPMDLSTIQEKLKTGEYPDKDAFFADIKLVFTNCEIYNPPHNAIYKQGQRLKKWVNKKIKEIDFED